MLGEFEKRYIYIYIVKHVPNHVWQIFANANQVKLVAVAVSSIIVTESTIRNFLYTKRLHRGLGYLCSLLGFQTGSAEQILYQQHGYRP